MVLQGGEGDGCTDRDDAVDGGDGAHLRDGVEGEQAGVGGVTLGDLQAEIGSSADEAVGGIVSEGLPEGRECRGPDEAALAVGVVNSLGGWSGCAQGITEWAAGLGAGDSVEGVPDGPVAGAAAEVAAELVVFAALVGEVVAVAAFEEGHNEARGAEATLRAHVFDESMLCGVEAVAVGEALDRDELPAVQRGQEDEAGVDSTPGGLPCSVSVEECDGSGAAVPFGTALLRAGEMGLTSQIAEQGGLWGEAVDGVLSSVEGKSNGVHESVLSGVTGTVNTAF